MSNKLAVVVYPPAPPDAETVTAVKPKGKPANWHAKLKLTPEVQDAICAKVRLGVPLQVAAMSSGITHHTFWRWMYLGDPQRAVKPLGPGNAKNKPGPVYRAFRAAVLEAKAQAESMVAGALTQAARLGDSRAAAFWLERRAPQRWARKDAEPQALPPAPMSGVDLSKLSADELAQLEVLLKRAAGGE